MALAPNSFRPCLNDENVIRERKVLVDSPFDIHDAAIVGFDGFCCFDKRFYFLVLETAGALHVFVYIGIDSFSFFDVEKGETIDADVDEDMQCTCCLEDQEIKALVKTAKTIESHYGRVMDIEWAIDKDFAFPDNIFIVQARPETVWSKRQKESKIGKKTGRQLLMEQAMKRIKLPE